MQIYECLTKDHDEVKNLLTDLIVLGDDEKKERVRLVGEIRDALIPHSRAEESIFYNSIRALDEKSGVMHSYAEHAAAEGLLRTLQVECGLGAGWRTTAKALKEALEHHIEEEETELFAKAHTLFNESEAAMMGLAFEKLKPEIKGEGVLKTSIEMVANLMPPRMKGSVTSFVADKATPHS
jgi:hemerythrin superfamily protein